MKQLWNERWKEYFKKNRLNLIYGNQEIIPLLENLEFKKVNFSPRIIRFYLDALNETYRLTFHLTKINNLCNPSMVKQISESHYSTCFDFTVWNEIYAFIKDFPFYEMMLDFKKESEASALHSLKDEMTGVRIQDVSFEDGQAFLVLENNQKIYVTELFKNKLKEVLE